jgi:hypothetical protein
VANIAKSAGTLFPTAIPALTGSAAPLDNWDMSLFKNLSIKERFRAQLRLEAFNAFNQTEWGTFNTAIQFNKAGKVINLPTQLGGTGGRFGFGRENSIRANSQRIL